VVLGLVTTKSGSLEDINSLKARVHQAAEVISEGIPRRSKEQALNQLCISPQCGFASTMEGNPITWEDQCKKLTLVVEGARAIWQG